MPETPRALNYFAWITLAATLVLICLGGLVTSKGVGMAVPDWPNSYGYNMFFFPISKWVGGIFYEHLHRLAASAVGLLTLVLAAWLWFRETRTWVRRLGLLAVALVVAQGIAGGLRVVLDRNQIGIVHAVLAQLFFILLGIIALATTSWWRRHPQSDLFVYDQRRLGYFYAFATGTIFLQLILGAMMRHQHAGLAIPDFPLAYGKIWPPLDPSSLAAINQHRVGVYDDSPVTAFQIVLQMAHRLMALWVLAATAAAAWVTGRRLGPRHYLSRFTQLWVVLVLFQAFLGAATVWTGKSADVATAHVAAGALILLAGGLLLSLTFRPSAREPEIHPSESLAAGFSTRFNLPAAAGPEARA